MSEGERLIAFEAAMQELANLQGVAARFRALRPAAEGLLGELMDLGRSLRQAARRGVFGEDAVDQAARQVRRLRDEWFAKLADLRASELYRAALLAYGEDDQGRLVELLPLLFADLEADRVEPPLFQALSLTGHRRGAGSPVRGPEEVAESVDALRRDGLRPRAHGRDWWDTDLPAVTLAAEVGAIDAPAALALERLPPTVALLREADSVLVFTPRLAADVSVVLAETTDDAWYEAAEGSFEEYRNQLAQALRQRGVAVEVRAAWS